ncbi:unnamed protein product, partial [Polarella glacialis]
MARLFTRAELYEQDFPWTLICGRVYAIGEFLPRHPGGQLIRRAVGEDATDLFLAHHGPDSPAVSVLAKYEIGHLLLSTSAAPAGGVAGGGGPSAAWGQRPLQRLLSVRLQEAGLGRPPAFPVAEGVALVMLMLFVLWAWLCYGCGWWRLNIAMA